MPKKCGSCIHKDACAAWIRHGETLYDDFEYSVEGCLCYAPRCVGCSEYATLDSGVSYCKFFSKILEDAYYIPSPDGYCDRGKRRSCDEG